MEQQKPRRERSRLLKSGLKSVWKHKLFTILMAVLIFLSGTTYTLLNSAQRSFTSSYNNVVNNGMMHEYVVKENFKADSTSTIKEKFASGNKDINKANAEAIAGTTNSIDVLYTLTGDYAKQVKSGTSTTTITKTIDFTLTADGNFDKEWEQISKQIDDYKSYLIYSTEKGLTDLFISDLRKDYKDELIVGDTKSLSVSFDQKAFNIVRYKNDTEVNKMYIYDGTEQFTTPLTDAQMERYLKQRLLDDGIDPATVTIDNTKGFKVFAKDSTGGSISVIDPSSYQAIISPAYANSNGKHSISPEKLTNLFNAHPDALKSWTSESQPVPTVLKDAGIDKSHVVWIDQTPFIIIGIGTTPDYLYPIVDQQHPVVNVKDQGILFVNNRGYERIFDGFRTNPREDYISLRFKPGVSESRKTQILKQIETKAHSKSGYPNTIKMVTSAFDKNDQLLLTQERVVFLQDLKKTIGSVSIATTTLLVVFVAAIVILVFQLLITIDRKILATQLALGYSKVRIAASKAVAALIIGIAPIFFGYLLGYGLQFWFIGHFDNYWTVPAFGTSFSWLSLLIILVLPVLGIWLLIFLVTLWVLQKPITSQLSAGGIVGSILLAKMVSSFKIVGVKGRYSVGLFAKNMFKLFLVAIASTISVGAITIGISSIGKSQQAYNATVKMNNYEFAVDLYSPTAQGGLYSVIKKDDLAPTGTPPYSPPAVLAGGTYDGTGAYNTGVQADQAHWHIPSFGDGVYGMAAAAKTHLSGASTYLKHMLQTKLFLDTDLGMNPWEIAEKLMPDNQKNTALNNEKELQKLAIDMGEDIKPLATGATDAEKKALVQRKWNVISKAISSNDGKMPYIISYGDVITDSSDETYTYLDTRINGESFKVFGVKDNTKMVNLGSDINKLKSYTGADIPILINHYISEKLNLDEGSTIDLSILNGYHRKENGKETIAQKARVVGITDGYDNKGLYTLQSKANEILGMNKNNGFNGIFTKSKNPAILQTLPLYSASGLWLGTDTIVGDWEAVLTDMLADANIWSPNDQANVASTASEFISKFSRTPFVGATSSVLWNEISKYTFRNISELSSFIINMIEIIAISLSVIFTVMIASLLLISNRKKIATLWTIGYRKREITRIFLTTYIIPMLLAIIIAIPVAISILFAMKVFIMNFGDILIPFQLVWYAPIVATLLVGTIFTLATVGTIMTQKQSKALAAFKGD